MKIGIIREGKIPPDARTPLTPEQCAFMQAKFPVKILVEPCKYRCFSDEEYKAAGILVQKDLSECDILMGVKEVPIHHLIPGKTYFFFSHTIKKQAHNRPLLQAILEKNIRLIDYETLTDEQGKRLIAFGGFAGMVGAHNALWTFGERTKAFRLKRMKDYLHYSDAKADYKNIRFPPLKIVLTGTGRVSTGALQVLRDMDIRQVSPEDFLEKKEPFAVFTELDSLHYVLRKDGGQFQKKDFYEHPEDFKSNFAPYFRAADILINGIFWDSRAPQFFDFEEMRQPDFNIRVIADVTCDLAPDASIPCTLRATSIAEPVFGFDPENEVETPPFQPDSIDIMAIDNLPNELCRDASISFGNQFIEHVLPRLLKPNSTTLERATVAENGSLGIHFQYLQDYVAEMAH